MTDAAKPDDRAAAELRGEHWIAGEASRGGGDAFHGVDPSSSELLEPSKPTIARPMAWPMSM